MAHFFAIPRLTAPALSLGIDHAVPCAAAAFIFFFHLKVLIFSKHLQCVFLAKMVK